MSGQNDVAERLSEFRRMRFAGNFYAESIRELVANFRDWFKCGEEERVNLLCLIFVRAEQPYDSPSSIESDERWKGLIVVLDDAVNCLNKQL